MMRRSFLHLLALLAVFGLIAAACGDDGETTETDPVSEEPTTDPVESEDPAVEDPAEEDPAEEVPEPAFTTHNVPADFATIQEAADAAAPGDLILIDEGVYNEGVIVQTPELVFRGVDRNTVILDGEFEDENGFIIFSDGVAIENMTIRNYSGNGIFWTGDYGDDIVVDGFRASYVTVHNIGAYGIYAFNAVNGQFDNSFGSGGDDSVYYIGQCVDCNSLVWNVEGMNSQLGYSGTNSSGTVIANSYFHDNMAGIVPSSASFEELYPNVGTQIIGNLVVNNNNDQVPSGNEGFRLAQGSGIVLAGTEAAIVERNTVIDNTRFGIVGVDWVAVALGGDVDFQLKDNVIRNNTVTGSTQGTDFLMGLLDTSAGGQGNCYQDNVYGESLPANIQDTFPCDGEEAAVEFSTIIELLDQFDSTFEPIDYKDVPVPEYNFDNMPGDPRTTAPEAATDLPMEVDLDALTAPEPR